MVSFLCRTMLTAAVLCCLLSFSYAQTDLHIRFTQENSVVTEANNVIKTIPWKQGVYNITGNKSWTITINPDKGNFECKAFQPSNILIAGRVISLPAQGTFKIDTADNQDLNQVSIKTQHPNVPLPSFHPLYKSELRNAQNLNSIMQANISKVRINLSANPKEGGTVKGSGTYITGSLLYYDAIPKDGYIFSEWTGQDLAQTGSIIAKEDITATAMFLKLYQIRVLNEEGKELWKTNAPHGKQLSIEAPTLKGLEFTGWKSKETDKVLTIIPTNNTTLVAKYQTPKKEIPAKIVLKSEPATAGETIGSGSYKVGSTIAYGAATVKQNYQFSHWTNAPWKEQSGTYQVKTNIIATAVFIPTFKVNLTRGKETIINRQMPDGAKLKFKAPDIQGLKFIGWSGDLEGKEQSGELEVKKDIIAEARYISVNTITVQNNIDKPPSTEKAPKGDVLKLTAPDHEGYKFKEWDFGSKEKTITVVVNGDRTYKAIYDKLLEVKLSYQPTNLNLEMIGSGNYPAGTEIDIAAPIVSGYEFIQWDGDMAGKSSQERIKLDKNISATAYYRKKEEVKEHKINPYKLNTGDEITVSTQATIQVSSLDWQGRALILPVGRIKLFGLSQAEAKTKIEQALIEAKGEAQPVQLAISPAAKTVSVTGAVNNPNAYRISHPVTLEEIILASGNFSRKADRNNITVKGPETVAYVRFDQAKSKQIDEGDEIIIGELPEIGTLAPLISNREPIQLGDE